MDDIELRVIEVVAKVVEMDIGDKQRVTLDSKLVDLGLEWYEDEKEKEKGWFSWLFEIPAGSPKAMAFGLDVYEFVGDLEEEFDIEIPDEDYVHWRTVRDVVDFVREHIQDSDRP